MTAKNTPAQRRTAEAPADAIEEVSASSGSPYLLESAGFTRIVTTHRNRALHTIEELQTEIEFLTMEIDQRRARVADLQMIVAKADAALGTVQEARPVTTAGNEG